MSVRKNITSGRLRDWLPEVASRNLSLETLTAEVVEAGKQLADSRAFLHFDPDDILRRSASLPEPSSQTPLLGLPVSVKDLMDVAGMPTTCGSRFYSEAAGIPVETAPFVAAWESRGALLVGKTHLNEFAYGITGENPWFGDCTIPDQPKRLTGGSSSGAAASVVGGAAAVALGTDTGGSLRVPAALCGLVSIRAPDWFTDHRGVFPLASSFDTLGWMQRHVGDLRLVASALGLAPATTATGKPFYVGIVNGAILEGVEPAILNGLEEFRSALVSAGCGVKTIDGKGWETAFDLFAPVQAREAFLVHQHWLARRADEYSAAVVARLRWGEGITPTAHEETMTRCAGLVAQMGDAFGQADVLVLPATPLTQLRADEDQSANRSRIIRLTAPASLGRWPVLTIPWLASAESPGVAFQIIAPAGQEARLVEFADLLEALLEEK